MSESCSRAETHASQVPCLRRPRSAPCQSSRARPTSAKNPAGWSRGTLVLVLATKMIEMEEREPLARQDARQQSPLPPPTSLGPLPKFASKADVSKEPSRVVPGYACACIGHEDDRDGRERAARAPRRTSAKPSAAADLAGPPATDCERSRRRQRARPGGLGVR